MFHCKLIFSWKRSFVLGNSFLIKYYFWICTIRLRTFLLWCFMKKCFFFRIRLSFWVLDNSIKSWAVFELFVKNVSNFLSTGPNFLKIVLWMQSTSCLTTWVVILNLRPYFKSWPNLNRSNFFFSHPNFFKLDFLKQIQLNEQTTKTSKKITNHLKSSKPFS